MQKIINGFWYLPKKVLKLLLSIFLILEINGCSNKSETPDIKTDLKVTKVSFNDISGWNNGDTGYHDCRCQCDPHSADDPCTSSVLLFSHSLHPPVKVFLSSS